MPDYDSGDLLTMAGLALLAFGALSGPKTTNIGPPPPPANPRAARVVQTYLTSGDAIAAGKILAQQVAAGNCLVAAYQINPQGHESPYFVVTVGKPTAALAQLGNYVPIWFSVFPTGWRPPILPMPF